jgi:hypothetical protein
MVYPGPFRKSKENRKIIIYKPVFSAPYYYLPVVLLGRVAIDERDT